MAKTYELEIIGQPGIYAESEHTVNMYFAEPEKGINKETGLLLLLAGYGGSSSSKVFTKMRQQFADVFNLVTVQCDYFGYEYMQNNVEVDITADMIKEVVTDAEFELLQMDYDKYAHILNGKIFKQIVDMGETPEHFNDMSLMQAMDNLRAVKVLMDILKNNKYTINQNRIYAYGFSHGAYLAYLCNAFWPGLFTGIVDNSAYITPYYLKNVRIVVNLEDGIHVEQSYQYKALEYIQDEDIVFLPEVYKQFINEAYILCYAGEKDYMTLLEKKKEFLNRVENTHVETVTEYRVDRVHFNSAGHGLGADFVALFYHAYRFLAQKEQERKKKRNRHEISYKDMVFETTMFQYEIRWEEGIPVLYRKKK